MIAPRAWNKHYNFWNHHIVLKIQPACINPYYIQVGIILHEYLVAQPSSFLDTRSNYSWSVAPESIYHPSMSIVT